MIYKFFRMKVMYNEFVKASNLCFKCLFAIFFTLCSRWESISDDRKERRKIHQLVVIHFNLNFASIYWWLSKNRFRIIHWWSKFLTRRGKNNDPIQKSQNLSPIVEFLQGNYQVIKVQKVHIQGYYKLNRSLLDITPNFIN